MAAPIPREPPVTSATLPDSFLANCASTLELVFMRLMAGDQNDSEASFVSHHPSVSFGSICERNGFDHRADSLQRAEGERVLGIYRRPGHRSRKRTHTE